MLPITRHGWKEILIGTLLLAAVAFALSLLAKPLALLVVPIFVWLLAFFRDPDRKVPSEPGAFVSPADGTVSDITDIEHDELVNGPAVRVGIFLSVFNVHINRSPCDGRVIAVRYKKGKFINAMHHGAASDQNESNTIVLVEPGGDKPVAVVKQIVGLIARRIVCDVAEGRNLQRGEHIGMIKFGSRTELTIPKRLEPDIRVRVGQKVRGAADIIAVTKMQESRS
jgi:phosphatidylserine decarboxylase